jgi:hypothetical protein
VRDWRTGAGRLPDGIGARCPRCWHRARPIAFATGDYAEFFGLYLGDGCISIHARTQQLRISLDSHYPLVVRDCRSLLERCFVWNKTGQVAADGGSTTVVHVYSRHLTCLFPQHGPGKKHDRRLLLEPWQQALVDGSPWSFLKGCIRSDGCVFVNRTGPYEYVSYDFSNLSADLLGIFADTCRAVGLRPRVYEKRVRLYRRDDVALLLENVGTKTSETLG